MKNKNKLISSLITIFIFLMLMTLFFLLIWFSRILHKTLLIIFIIFFALQLIQFCVSIYIINSKRKIEVKTSWILMMNLPLIGLVLFFSIGWIPFKLKTKEENIKERQKYKNKELYLFSEQYLKENNNSFKSVYFMQQNPIYINNDFEIVHQKDLFEKTIKLIRSAKKTIDIQYYIISSSKWMKLLVNELIIQSKKGIEIRFMYDYAGAYKRKVEPLIKELIFNKIKVAIFNPVIITKYTPLTNFRSHRKSIIIDNKYCLTGGSNIGDEYLNIKKELANWYDLNFLLTGEIVNSFSLLFVHDWNTLAKLKNKMKKEEQNLTLPIFCYSKAKNIMQLVETEPTNQNKILRELIIDAISNAKKRVWFSTPYLVIDDYLIETIQFVRSKKIDIRFFLPGVPDDKKYVLTVNRSNYKNLLSLGVKIYEYDGFLHSKGILIDDDFCLLGTFNLDFRSFIINYETSIQIKSLSIANQLEKVFHEIQLSSKEIDLKFFNENYKFIDKIKLWFIKVIFPLL